MAFSPFDAPASQGLSTRAQDIFDTPDLLEHILSFLEADQLFIARKVSHNTTEVTAGSPKLQRMLHLPDLYSFFRCFPRNKFPSFHNLTTFGDGPTTRLPHAYFHDLRGPNLPVTGSPYRRMLICQPPVNTIDISVDGCTSEADGRRSIAGLACKIFLEGGLSVGDFYSVTHQLQSVHKYCDWASSHELNANGSVYVGVDSETVIRLRPDDPMFVGRMSWR